MKNVIWVVASIIVLTSAGVRADYEQGCDDPAYHQFIASRYAYYEAKNRRLLVDTWRDYQRSLAISDNPFQIIGDLSRHLKYSAQFDPVSEVEAKIDRVFEHADALSVKQQIAGDVFDSFSSEKHAVGIAQAWLAYRKGNPDEAFDALLKSIEAGDAAVLSSFGPDWNFVRQIYRDGHIAPVIAYINKTKAFWTGPRPDRLRYVWRAMINAECEIQFDFFDTIKVLELRLSVRDVNRRQ